MTGFDVARLARLARLELQPKEERALRADLERIVAYLDQLQTVDVAGVEPTLHPSPHAMALRSDRIGEHLERAQVLAGAPEHDGAHFVVPRVL